MRLLIAAGGTGGHFYPALAVLEALKTRIDVHPTFVGTSRGIEARVVPQLGYPLETIDVAALNRVGAGALWRGLAKLPRAAWRSMQIVRRVRPDAVLSVGGYASGPITAMAIAMRVPAAVIEPNAMPGLTNRLVGRFVRRAYLSYAEAAVSFGADAVREFGNPVRASFVERARQAKRDGREVPHVLVVGGSQGARSINRAMPEALARARARGATFTLEHQTGANDRDDVARAYAERGLDAEVVPFIDDVAGAMIRADLVVGRAGAGTVAELCVVGRAALYVPLATAADDHQRKNARAMADRGAASVLDPDDLTPDTLADRIVTLLADRATLVGMGERARACGRPDAAAEIAADLIEMVRT